jgi:hypothetical protein
VLLRNVQPGFTQLVWQRVFVNFFKKFRAKRVQDLEATADNALHQSVHSGLICVHLCASVVKIPHFAAYVPDAAVKRAFTSPAVEI